jgi:hypothetical protein
MFIHRLFPSSLAIGNSKIASVHVVERTPGAQSLPSRLNDCIRLRLARLFVQGNDSQHTARAVSLTVIAEFLNSLGTGYAAKIRIEVPANGGR